MTTRAILLAALVGVLAWGSAGCTSEDTSSGDGTAQDRGDGSGADPAARPSLVGKTDQVQIGMTEAQVEALLGPPKTTVAFGDEGGFQKLWGEGDESFAAGFADGKVVFMTGGRRTAAQLAPRVAENFAKVKEGMTQDEVRALLGPPTSTAGTASDKGAFQVWTWQGEARSYVVDFADGKVRKTSAGEVEP